MPGILRRLGRPYACPICAGRFRRFAPGGDNGRPGARCPRCGSLERHRLLWLWLRDGTDLGRRPLRLLHVAPEPGLAARLRALPLLEYEAGDLEPGPGVARLDLTRIDRPDGAYDRILCLHVLEHVEDERAALSELRRVLAPGGWAVLQVPIVGERTWEDPTARTPAERRARFGQADHVRAYGRDFPARLRAAGFAVETVSWLDRLTPGERERHRLVPDGWEHAPGLLGFFLARR